MRKKPIDQTIQQWVRKVAESGRRGWFKEGVGRNAVWSYAGSEDIGVGTRSTLTLMPTMVAIVHWWNNEPRHDALSSRSVYGVGWSVLLLKPKMETLVGFKTPAQARRAVEEHLVEASLAS